MRSEMWWDLHLRISSALWSARLLATGLLAEPWEEGGFATASVAIGPGRSSDPSGAGWALRVGFPSKLLLCGAGRGEKSCHAARERKITWGGLLLREKPTQLLLKQQR